MGQRTKDLEFDMKVEELRGAERSLIGIKQIFNNFFIHSSGLKNICRDVYTGLMISYSEKSLYWNQIKEIFQIYKEVDELYNCLAKTVGTLSNQTIEWDKIFEDSKRNISLREEYRVTYDHYDYKIEKLIGWKNHKINKGNKETQHEIDRFERVKNILYLINL
jgi:hypothetical protein